MDYYGFPPYVPVAQRQAQAREKIKRMRKKGLNVQPVEIEGRKITRTFWGDAWCQHLEQFSDYSNRLPRGRTYVRNGSVCHLEINKGYIRALVSGSSLYNIKISITPLAAARWTIIKKCCAGQIGSLLELLQGKLSREVMQIVTDPKKGLFPSPGAIKFDCDCPDWATMCKHISAVLYGIGARLDQQPELLFVLRGVDHSDLVCADIQLPAGKIGSKRHRLSGDLSSVFGIELDEAILSPEKSLAKTTIKKKPKKTIRPTGKSVARLRKRFGMNLTQFALLVGVKPNTITNWENKTGRLTLRPDNLDALTRVNELNKIQAWKFT